MAKAVSHQQLIDDARLYADQRTSTFLTDTEVSRLVNLQIGELYDLLVEARGHEFYATSDTIAIAAGTAAYNLPDDFYQLLALNLEWVDDDHEPVDPLNHQGDIWRYADIEWQRWSAKGYRLRGSQIDIYPTPSSAVTARLHYVPVFTDLPIVVGEATTFEGEFDGVNGWEKLVVLGVAIEMLEIEEKGSGATLREAFERQYERIASLAADRDAAAEVQVRDVSDRRVRRYPTATGSTQ